MPIQHNEYEQGFDPENEKSAIHWHAAPAAPQNSRPKMDNQVVTNPENQALIPENQAVENTKAPVKMGALPTSFLGNLKTEGANTNNLPNTRPVPPPVNNLAAQTQQAPAAPTVVSPETQRLEKLNLLRQKMDNLGRAEEFKYFENKHKGLIIKPLPDADFSGLDTALSDLEQKLSAEQPFEISKIGEFQTRAAGLPILEEYYAAWLQSKSGISKNEGAGKVMDLRGQIHKKYPEIYVQIQTIEFGNSGSTDVGKKYAYKRLLAGSAPKIENAENQPIESEKISENTAVQGLLTQMQTAYGVDMSGVEVIKNSPEADKQDAVGVSIGNEIHLAKGKFTQSNPEAMGLLAHELTHFVQKEQDRVTADAIFKGQAVNTDPKLEAEADLVAEKYLAQAPLPTLSTAKSGQGEATDEVAQLKPKKPFAEWVQGMQGLTEKNGFIMYCVDYDFVVRELRTGRCWWKAHGQKSSYHTNTCDFMPMRPTENGWQELTAVEIQNLGIPVPTANNAPVAPTQKPTAWDNIKAATEQQAANTLKNTDTKLDKKLTEGQPDKAYIYSNKGLYIGDCSNTSVKGIFFMQENIADDLIQNPEKLAATNEMGKSLINPLSLCEFYIGANTVKALHALWKRTKTAGREYGGALHADPTTKELRFEECKHCAEGTSSNTVVGLSTFGLDSPNEFVASVHTHPYDEGSKHTIYDSPDEAKHVEFPTQPADYISMSDIWDKKDADKKNAQPSVKRLLGGLGIIAHQHGITIYRHTGEELVDNPNYKPFNSGSNKYTFDPKKTFKESDIAGSKTIHRIRWKNLNLQP